MPLDKNIRKVLVIGSGPIVIGQAAEFDYAGTQACRALREDGIEIVLINSNPATIMTDKWMADKIYIEPLTLTTVKRVIETERPDAILSGLGGQTALTLCMELAKDGFLARNGVKLLGSSPECIDKAEDRQIFKDTMESIGQPCIPSKVVNDVDSALEFAKEIGYPVIVRPAFTLGGSGGGIANDAEELHEIARNGLALSPITQVLIEKCIAGWKEIEFEVIRDKAGNVLTVCSMENLDPVGVHTGDSIVIAPAVSLSDKEYQMLRSASLNIIEALGVEGGCNCQFALHPTSFEYAVIEVNPRVSRSSALASKATGYPIAKVATKIALGYRLDEIKNAVTGNTFAAFEPALDYVAVKFPKWPFDKFVYAKRDLGTQMKATGEVMSISDSFESALMKALRGAEISVDTVRLPKLKDMSDEEIRAGIGRTTDERLFYVAEGLYRGISIDEIHQITMIDNWFLSKINNLIKYEKAIAENLDADLYIKGKKLGFTDKALERISGKSVAEFNSLASVTYKMVDTCAGEFEAVTPYFYATYNTAEAGGENEASIEDTTGAKTVIVIGSGPIRIGQGIEFDYAAVHCVHALRELGYRVVIINNNPETVSTDFDTGDRLYFEPLTPEDVLNIIDQEKPVGVVVAFGGQTAIKLTKTLAQNNINIIGTSADSIDMAEDRERFDALLERLGVKRPKGYSVLTKEEAFEAAHALEYPILLRPSYVLGGQNMTIAFHDDDVEEYMNIILGQGIENPVLIDKYIQGKEIEVDAIYDGHDVLIPGIMEHIERAGIHSGDSIAIYPAKHIYDRMAKKLVDTTRALCEGLASIGIVNIQYIVKDDEIYVIEVNPRASRTVPYMSKVTGVLMVDCAIRVSLGEKLADMDYGVGFYRQSPYTCVKVPVFSFEKLTDVDTQLGPEMKSTGEVLGVGRNLSEALFKGLVAAGYKMYKHGGVLITVRDSDKSEIVEVAKKFDSLGFNLYATPGNAAALEAAGMKVEVVHKIHESDTNNTMTLLESGKVNYIISTSAKGRLPARDSVKLRRRAVMLGIPCLTAIDTADALADSLMSRYSEINTELVDINNMREKRKVINFTKMQGCGNDYIYIDCLEKMVSSPESLSVYMSDRHFGVGGDGIVLIAPSRVADCRMIMFNLDGSEGNMCGNAIRCVGKYMYDVAGHKKKHMTVETKSGIKKLELMTLGDEVVRVKVDMGKAELTPSKIPVTLEGDAIINRPVDYNGTTYNVTCVSMGNPHAVIFTDLVDALDLEKIGPDFETHEIFPERVNTEFIKVIDEHTLKMRVWERGSGETLACGTGACAAAVAACLNGYCKKGEDIKVILRGGELIIRYTDEAVYMTGNCEKVFTGSIEI
ncbi:MAG: carbamoyl-phosphate synthase large subunit [Clostridiales bacterium]|nr:carbamoyl-phosphate synthase large subunit [Clostridiales bacterium]